MRYQFVGASTTGRSVNVDSSRALNCFAEVSTSQRGRTMLALYGTPGLERVVTFPGSGAIRGQFVTAQERLFVVQGSTLYEMDTTLSVTARGTLLTSTGVVSMEENGIDLVLVDGPYGYHLTLLTNVFAQITDPDFPGADVVAFLDGYFLFNRPGTQQFYWSGLYAVTFDGADFASVEGTPDNLVSLLVAHRELWLFGTRSTEVWVNVGAAPPLSPFQRAQPGVLTLGCDAVHSVVRLGEAIAWLTRNDQGRAIVVAATGYSPQRISTHAVEQSLAEITTLRDCVAWAYQKEGHTFLVLTFPTADLTWCYDLSTGLWHERAYLNPTTGLFERHRGVNHSFFNNTHWVGDRADGRLYKLNENYYSDDGHALRREVVWPPVFDQERGSRVLHRRFQVDMETGIGLSGGVTPGADPQLLISYSDDQGHTWSPERHVSAGLLGETTRRAQLWRLGQARDRRYKVAFTDPCTFALMGAFLDVEPASS